MASQDARTDDIESRDLVANAARELQKRPPKHPSRWTEKERAWLQSWLRHGNATRAVREAGYDVDPEDDNLAAVMGHEILNRPHIQVAIAAAYAEMEQRYAITPENILAELAKIGFSRLDDYYDVETGKPVLNLKKAGKAALAALQSIQIKPTEYGDEVKLTLHPKATALELLGKHKKMWTDQLAVTGALEMTHRLAQARSRARIEPPTIEGEANDLGEDEGEAA
jgi:phage terminase small subunit